MDVATTGKNKYENIWKLNRLEGMYEGKNIQCFTACGEEFYASYRNSSSSRTASGNRKFFY